MIEEWRSVVGFEGYYEVSDQGRVRSVDRRVTHPRSGTRLVRGRLMSPRQESNGYMRLNLARGGGKKRVSLHVAVLEAFVGPRPEGMEGCHSPNPDKADNRLANLRWDTASENGRDRTRHGNNAQANKTHCPRGHPLEEPNIPQFSKRRGERSCLACQRAGSYARNVLGGPVTQELTDVYYHRIINEAAPAATS